MRNSARLILRDSVAARLPFVRQEDQLLANRDIILILRSASCHMRSLIFCSHWSRATGGHLIHCEYDLAQRHSGNQTLGDNIMRIFKTVLIVVLALPVGFTLLLGVLWLTSFVDPAPAQDNCSFRGVSKSEYLQLLTQAKGQSWTVWPGLSRGIFWPSDRLFVIPSALFEQSLGDKLTRSVESLSFNHESPDTQLAAAHAVMRSIGADYVSTLEARQYHVGDTLKPAVIQFKYFIPQRRLAPLCLGCLLWWWTTIHVDFDRDLVTSNPTLNRIVVLNGSLDYGPQKEAERNGVCPELTPGSQ